VMAGDHDVWLAVCTGQDCERAKSVQAVEFLRTLPYVRQGNKDYDDISNVATQMRLIQAEIREVVCSQGSPADDTYLIKSGTFKLVDRSSGQPREVAMVGQGDILNDTE